MKKILYQYVNLLVDCVPQRRAHNNRTIGVYCGEVHLFSIPNREVKPTSADGTANAGEYDDATLGAPNRGPLFFCPVAAIDDQDEQGDNDARKQPTGYWNLIW
jgi:hypothetical protein